MTTEYPPPVLRAPSPASSIGTTYGPDQTSSSDSESQLTESQFVRKWEEKLGLGKPSREELKANESPLVPKPNSEAEEKGEYSPVRLISQTLIGRFHPEQYEKILAHLRAEVQALEDDELFEQMVLRGSKAALEPQPTSNSIDVLMRNMMMPSSNLDVANGPWNQIDNGSLHEGGRSPVVTSNHPPPGGDVAVTPRRGKGKGKGKRRKN